MKKVLVVFGGRSAEHDVSIITAHIPIMQSLAASSRDYEILPLYIAKDGSWYSEAQLNDLEFYRQPDLEARLRKLKKVQLLFDGGLTLVWPGLKPRSVKIDVVFPAMHGTFGEDGSLMGLLRMAGVAFVGCDVAASAVAMDKVLTKQVTGADGIPSVPYVWFDGGIWANHRAELQAKISKLAFPVFVKPVHLGSSIAITKVEQPSELANAVEVALHYDDKVIVEHGIKDLIEVTLPIMGNEELRLGEVEQPLAKFFDFEEKYLKNGKKGGSVNSQYSKIPADLPPKLMKEVQDMGQAVFRSIGASGIARIDFLIDAITKQVFMNEVNTLPGSLYHHNWRVAGVSNVTLVDELIRLAEERFQAQQSKTYTFRSQVLKYAGSGKTGRE